MGFFSYLCSKSNTSIPADCVEPTEVVAFMPDGKILKGVYDGYGNIGGESFTHAIYDRMQPDRWQVQLNPEESRIKKRERFNDYEYEFRVKLTPPADLQGYYEYLTTSSYIFKDNKKNIREAFDEKAHFIERDAAFEAGQQYIKIIKAEHYDPKTDNYQSISASKSCPYQGYFYDDGYDWNVPDDQQQDTPSMGM